MDLGISGKVAMVAAGSKGIGLAVARELAHEGCQVSICARNVVGLDTVTLGLGSVGRVVQADVSLPDDLERWYEDTARSLGAPQILITNTGGPPAGPLSQMSDTQWQSGVDSTLMNVIRLARLCSEDMIRAGWGRIVHISSLVAKEPSNILPISSVLRAGLRAMTRLQSTELAPYGITVNSVLPGHTLTDRQRHLAEIRARDTGGTIEEALERQGKEIPVGRLGDPIEIAAAVAFLCSKRASFITGVSLLVDGGNTKAFD